MKTGLVTSDTFQNHDTGPGHPEQIARISVINENFKKLNNPNILWKKPSIISDEIIKNTHDAKYVDLVKKSFPSKGFSSLDGDTIISPGSKEATFDAAGSIIAAIDGIQNKEFKNAFASVRPPGHHCSQNRAAGFCILNNIAIGAKYLLNKYKYKKIAIIDFDVHHGNGTQDIFYNNSKVHYYSTHQYPLYPGTGDTNETGCGNIINVPLKAGTGSEIYQEIFDQKIMQGLDEQKPDFIILSAGFDAHAADPLANLNLIEKDFEAITMKLKSLANQYCGGKIVSMLEGGYDIHALEQSMITHLKVLQNND